MATHVATNPSKAPPGADNNNIAQEHAGASYAHAVLNFKQVDSNKENINESDPNNDTTQPSRNKTVSNQNALAIQEPNQEPPSVDDGGGGFTPVVSHSRKERKNERNKKNREVHSNKNANVNADKRDNNRDPTNRDVNVNREQAPKESVQEKEETSNRKVFVEAPLPTVNPWQKKTGPSVTKHEVEKRVLQPQKQELIVNGQTSKPPKEKKKIHQKVIIMHISNFMTCYLIRSRNDIFKNNIYVDVV